MADKNSKKDEIKVPKESSHKDAIDNKVIFATEDDDVSLNCDGESCNFTYPDTNKE